jgi:uncharacterized glyoxalase superfamily protein PhnB
MRVMVMVKATKGSEAGEMPSEQLMADMGRFNEQLADAGLMKAGDGLRPSSDGVRVRFSGASRTVTDGPFPETKELVAGYWIWEVKSMEEAVEWVKKCPNPMMEDSDIEIRPLYEFDDFAEADPTGEIRAREEALGARLATDGATVQCYLTLGGRCEEALEFYKQAAGARVDVVMRFDESPDPVPEGMLPPGFEKKVMHAQFTIGTTTVMAGDGCGNEGKPAAFSLALTVKTPDAADRVFNALAEGGAVTMPLGKTFWSPRFGMLTDKFGISWMIMVPGQGC